MRARRAIAAGLLFCGITVVGAPVRAGGFDRAIESAMPRVMKLYGLSAGLEKGYGTGVVVSPKGMVLTVFSLLIDSKELRAVDHNGNTYGASVIARDRDRQLALLQLKPFEGPDAHTVAPFPDVFLFFDLDHESELHPGDWVLSAGNAFKIAAGAEPVSIAHGVFSARTRLDARRRRKDFPYRGDVLVIDAITSNPGAPGSALVNLSGEFVGMIGREVVSNLTHTHFNCAMPRDVLAKFVDESINADAHAETLMAERRMMDDEPAKRFDPGIRLSRMGYRKVLPFVERVVSGSPAAEAGVRVDDLILSMNGRNISDANTYRDRLSALRPGDSVNLVIQRGNAIVSVRIRPEGS